ncbi:neuroligin-4, Y-linked-like isoform X2 [Lineus longissimus]
MDPDEVEPWGGTLNATKFGSTCRASEDCLFLNIYTPYKNTDPEERRYPVMVYIHGGSYSFGSGNSYNGFTLAQFGVVFVTIAYRLYIPGFLSSGTDDLPGNYGILDQIQALKWIKKRIQFFRGDPENVLIFGNSAGGGSVGVHLLSPLSKGLFHRAVIQSGPVNAHWGMYGKNESPKKYFRGVTEAIGCNYGTTKDMVNCLRELPYDVLMGRQMNIVFKSFAMAESDNKPTVDGRVIPKHYEDLIKEGAVNRVPVMLGVTSEEGAKIFWYFHNRRFTEDFYPQADLELDDGIDRKSFLKMIEHAVWKLLGFPREAVPIVQFEYTNWSAPNDPFTTRSQVFKFCTDTDMLVPTQVLATDLAGLNLDVYQYVFDHKIKNINITLGYVGQWIKDYSYHEIELDLLLGIPFSHLRYSYFYTDPHFTATDKKISYQIMKYWTNFAKYGNPNERTNTANDVKWGKFTSSNEGYLYIGSSGIENRYHLEASKVALWRELLPTFKQNPEETKQNYKTLFFVFVSTTVAFVVLVVLLVLYMVRPKLGASKLSQCGKKDKKVKQENNANNEYHPVQT